MKKLLADTITQKNKGAKTAPLGVLLLHNFNKINRLIIGASGAPLTVLKGFTHFTPSCDNMIHCS